MVTVKEVAKHAGVSLATVSRVINGAENVSPAIREKVQHSIKELGYFPNNAGSRARSSKSWLDCRIVAQSAFPVFHGADSRL